MCAHVHVHTCIHMCCGGCAVWSACCSCGLSLSTFTYVCGVCGNKLRVAGIHGKHFYLPTPSPLKLSFMCLCVGWWTACTMIGLWGSEDNLHKLVSSFHCVCLGIEPRSLGLVANAFTLLSHCWPCKASFYSSFYRKLL